MDVTITCGVIAFVLFIMAFVSKRRFGILGLGLAAGSTLAKIWGDDAGFLASVLGIRQTTFSVAVILAVIILLPAFILFFHGSTYKGKFFRTVGSLMFATLAFAFLIDPLGHMLVLSGSGAEVFQKLSDNQSLIIGVGLILAVGDIFLTKPTSNLAEKHHKH